MEDPREVDSDEELLSLLEASESSNLFLSSVDNVNLITEYTKYGVFKVKEPQSPGLDLTQSTLYNEMVSTLKHLSDSYTLHKYLRYLYVKDLSHLSKNVNFSRADYYDDTMKHYEVLVHSRPLHLIGKCTLREIDGPVGMVNNDNLTFRAVNSVMTSSDVLNVIPSLGFKLSKTQNVLSQVFHMNYGSTAYAQVSLIRHYDSKGEVAPGLLLAEIKCFGNADLEFYKTRINTLAKLLYKFLKF